MRSDLEIAQAARLRPIVPLAATALGIPPEALEPYGHYKAKLGLDYLDALAPHPDGRLVLVTAITPTPPGEGKTTTTVGLGDALNHLGHRALICLREPSLGPCFGRKGGATGGGLAQLLPMEDINLHFTGDFHAIASANNLLAALIDNHIFQGNALELDPSRISWKRVVDMNDRPLREIRIGLGRNNGVVRDEGFNIVVASEVMAILCLARSLADLKRRLGAIVVGYDRAGREVSAAQLKADGAMAALLKEAIKPNLVQTLAGNPAFVHGGPFANIAHGCSSVIATRAALKLADYVVTEAGFGADLGAEKFLDIKCRKAGLEPDCAVLVATVRALKYHGGAALAEIGREDLAALAAGLVNLERHLDNLRSVFGLRCVVAINPFAQDTPAELALIHEACARWGVDCVEARHWAQGAPGAAELARRVVALCADAPSVPRYAYADDADLWSKIEAVARRVYRASAISAEPALHAQLEAWQAQGYGRLPVCIAKTPYSFAADAKLLGAPAGHIVPLRELRLAAGAGFVVAICGDVLTMPGLPARPNAEAIGIDDHGRITGLF